MDFGFTEEQTLIKDSARELLSKELPKDKLREIQESETGFSKELWDKIVEAGWLGIIFPEEYGGSGFSFLELAVLYEECGRALMPTVFFSTVTGGLAILNGSMPEQKKSILPEVIQGDKLITLAVMEPQAIHDLNHIQSRAGIRRGKYYLSGTKLFVQNAATADYLIVAVRTDDGAAENSITLFLVDRKREGIKYLPLNTFGLDPQSEVVFDDVEVLPEDILGHLGSGKETLDKTWEQATALQCVEMVGGAQEVLRMTVDYVKKRIQFGRPIGSFQVVQHQLADVSLGIEGARHTSYRAVWRLSEGRPCAREVSLAKAWIGEVYKNATLVCHQLHGGIGYALEYDLHLYSNRAKSSEIWLGTKDYHLQRLADELGL